MPEGQTTIVLDILSSAENAKQKTERYTMKMCLCNNVITDLPNQTNQSIKIAFSRAPLHDQSSGAPYIVTKPNITHYPT